MTESAKRPAGAIVGPSHCVRWSLHARSGVVESVVPHDRIFGIGGAPIWSKAVFEKAEELASDGSSLAVMVGDFRFGNSICLTDHSARDHAFLDGHLSIDLNAITPEHDYEMLERSLSTLQLWHKRFGSRAKYIFWDLFARQVHDRLSGKYISNKKYVHPTFDYDVIAERTDDLEKYDVFSLLAHPMHELSRLFVDQSAHPSQIGYRFLDNILGRGAGPSEAYRQAVDQIEGALFDVAGKSQALNAGKVLLTGRSVWLETLSRYLGADGAYRLADQGIIVAPLLHVQGQPTLQQMVPDAEQLRHCRRVVFAPERTDLRRELSQRFGTRDDAWDDIYLIDWESAVAPTIKNRRETPRFPHQAPYSPVPAHYISLEVSPHMVEQGPLGTPSWAGLLLILNVIASGLEFSPGIGSPHQSTHGSP